MRFNTRVHTKEFLLANPAVLGDLCKTSAVFAKSDLAQDFDILNVEVDSDSQYKAAHLLASIQFDWAKTPAAQNIDVISIETPGGFKVAHVIARHDDITEWSLTPIAQLKEVLEMCDGTGNYVSHYLALSSKKWAISEFAQDHAYISTKQPNGKYLAHTLATHNKPWLTTPAAQDFRNLKLQNEDGRTVALVIVNKHFRDLGRLEETKAWMDSAAAKDKKVLLLTNSNGASVAQHMMFDLVEKKQIDLMLNLISQGAAIQYKVQKDITKGVFLSQINMTANDIKKFGTEAENLISDENEPSIKAKILIAYYSTLKNLIPILSRDSAKEAVETCIRTAENQLASMIENEPKIAGQFAEFSEDNCSPWFEFYRRHQAKDSFNVDLDGQVKDDCANSSETMLIY
jgi:hypothetical protein